MAQKITLINLRQMQSGEIIEEGVIRVDRNVDILLNYETESASVSIGIQRNPFHGNLSKNTFGNRFIHQRRFEAMNSGCYRND